MSDFYALLAVILFVLCGVFAILIAKEAVENIGAAWAFFSIFGLLGLFFAAGARA